MRVERGHNPQHLFALNLTLPLARGPSLRLLAVGLSVEELSYDFEARIGTGGFAREDSGED
jgi:hypothetical protein